MTIRSIVVLFTAGLCTLNAQKPVPAPAKTSQTDLPIDSAKLFGDISASYYHADDLSGMDCGVVLDWTTLSKKFGNVPADRMEQLNGMLVEFHARRGTDLGVDILWQHGVPASKETLERGIKQMLSGFFQIFWAFNGSLASPVGPDKFLAERQKGGGYILRYSSTGMKISEEANSDRVLTKLHVESPALTADMEPHFSPSPNPAPGDLRRLTSIDSSQQMGTTTMNVQVSWDYQAVDGINIPQHVSVAIGGAFSLPLEFSRCSVTRKMIPRANEQ